MNKDNYELSQWKIKSVGACIRDGYRLFTGKFRKIFRATWPIALVYALLSGILETLATSMTTIFNEPSPIAVYLALTLTALCLIVSLVLTFVMGRKLVKQAHVNVRPFSFPPRYWGGAFLVLLVVVIVTMGIILFTGLPAMVLMAASIVSQAGVMQGDPSGMPDYLIWAKLLAFTLSGFIEAYVLLSALFPFYHLYGSAKIQEKERTQISF